MNANVFFNRHQGETAFVVGYGGSLHPAHPHYDGFEWDSLKGKLVIGHNNSIRDLIPTYWFFTDGPIWKENSNLQTIPKTLPIVVPSTMKQVGFPWKDQAYGVLLRSEWVPQSNMLYMANTVATGGLCFAWQLGARKIVLVGVDCYAHPTGPYYADGKPLPSANMKRAKVLKPDIRMEARHFKWIESFKHIDLMFKRTKCYEEGLEIYNTSMHSPMDLFPKKSIREILEES